MEKISPGVCVCSHCIRIVLECLKAGEELSWWFVHQSELLCAEEARRELIDVVDSVSLRQVAKLRIVEATPEYTWIMTTNNRIFISEYR